MDQNMTGTANMQPQGMMQPQETMQPQGMMQPEAMMQPQGMMQSQGMMQPQETMQPEAMMQPQAQTMTPDPNQVAYMALQSMTSGYLAMDIDTLSQLINQISFSEYPAYIQMQFVQMLETRKKSLSDQKDRELNKERYEEIKGYMNSVISMTSEEAEHLKREIVMKEYPAYVTIGIEEMINARVFENDMSNLMNICNCFDGLGKGDIQTITEQAQASGASQQSLSLYMSKLYERMFNISIGSIYSYACFFNQLVMKYQIGVESIGLAGFSPNYAAMVNTFKQEFGITDPYEIPIFMMTGKPYLAVTQDKIFIKIDGMKYYYNLADIYSFTSTKKMLADALTIILKNQQSIVLPGTFNKTSIVGVVNFMNEFVNTIANKLIPASDPNMPYAGQVIPFDAAQFCVNVEQFLLSPNNIANRFVSNISSLNSTLKIGSIHIANQPNWQQSVQKVLQSYGIVYESPFVLYQDKSVLGTAKEGFALSYNNLYLKKANQGTVSLPYSAIANLCISEQMNCIKIETKDNYMFYLDTLLLDEFKTKKMLECIGDLIYSFQIIE